MALLLALDRLRRLPLAVVGDHSQCDAFLLAKVLHSVAACQARLGRVAKGLDDRQRAQPVRLLCLPLLAEPRHLDLLAYTRC